MTERTIRFFNGIRVYFLGGALYGLIELLWRGKTHWSMVLTGGAVLLILMKVNKSFYASPLILRCLIGSALITAVELTVGCIVNLRWQLAVWDYSSMSLDFLGQICPLYSCLWFFLCIPIYALCPFFDRIMHGKRYTPSKEELICQRNASNHSNHHRL